ncbi:M14 family metallocarboxypeptidase [Paraferrimonas sp. SM1919]|uniref:M14 family metallopeptidase n=1 Tax=Paraferrimonas sp. SM1919 TaxID=2662263 RepID=UPI0013D067E7|nr:M14 family metallocarboxypeptidase [Paraferrimonas sp. SM1919]
MATSFYPIGNQNQPWNDSHKQAWFERQHIQRSYQQHVLDKLDSIRQPWQVSQYGALDIDINRYPLKYISSRPWHQSKPWVLITGGVHGYETSGVQGAIAALPYLEKYLDRLNLIICPCVSPWGYEVINRWNPKAIDPNRSFYANSPAEESAALMTLVKSIGSEPLMHIDLHETTDTDESEFRPALAARDGNDYIAGIIPDGFYLVGDSANPQDAFQQYIISQVETVTHIAPADENNQIIGSNVTQKGVINYPCTELGLCAGMTAAKYKTTTEVYPDSDSASDEQCNQAQVAAVIAAIDFALKDSD